MIPGHPYETDEIDRQRSEQGRWLKLLRNHQSSGADLSTVPFAGESPSVEVEWAFRAAADRHISQHIEWLKSIEATRNDELIKAAAPPRRALAPHRTQLIDGAFRSAMNGESDDDPVDETTIGELRVLLEAAEHFQPSFPGEG
ncbi:MAG: hypothetical protein ACHQDC_04655 [Acidimicrobiales bacterium]